MTRQLASLLSRTISRVRLRRSKGLLEKESREKAVRKMYSAVHKFYDPEYPILSRLSSTTRPYLVNELARNQVSSGAGITHSNRSRKNQTSKSSFRNTLPAHSRLASAILTACCLPSASALM